MKHSLLAALTLAFAAALPAQDPSEAAAPPTAVAAQPTWTSIQAWPVSGCLLTGRALEEGKAKTFEVDGRTFHTCCERCQAKVEADPATYVKKLDEAVVAAQLASYPLDTCPMSGRKLGDKAKSVVVEGTLVRVCCERCEAKAPAQAAELAAKVVAAAHAAQSKDYPLTTCPVSGEKVDAESTEVMYGTTLVRFCCDDCIDEFKKAPAATLEKLAQARAAKTDGGKGGAANEVEGKPAKKPGDGAGQGAAAAGACCSESAKACCEEKIANGQAKACCQEKAKAQTKAKDTPPIKSPN